MYWYLPFAWTMSFWEELSQAPAFVVSEMQADDIDVAADLHVEAFSHPWSGDEFASLLAQGGSFGFVARRKNHPLAPPLGFVLARLTVDEAEILTIAVNKAARGKGIGRLLMDRVLERLHAERAIALYLEVDETNPAALALYRKLRFEEVGRRPSYYAGADGTRTSAIVLKRTLRT